jgi:hypothetical protein
MKRKFSRDAESNAILSAPRSEFHINKQLAPFAAFAATAVSSAFVAPVTTRAAPIVYNESTGGDLSEYTPFFTFVFDSGTNLVSGISGVVFNIDFDSFAFRIPAGLKMSEGSLVINDLTGDITSLGWRLGKGSADSNGGDLVAYVGGNSPGSSVLPALDADIYNLTSTGIGGSGQRTASYTFTFVLAPVPEPTSLWLLAAPALLLGRPVQRRGRT